MFNHPGVENRNITLGVRQSCKTRDLCPGRGFGESEHEGVVLFPGLHSSFFFPRLLTGGLGRTIHIQANKQFTINKHTNCTDFQGHAVMEVKQELTKLEGLNVNQVISLLKSWKLDTIMADT